MYEHRAHTKCGAQCLLRVTIIIGKTKSPRALDSERAPGTQPLSGFREPNSGLEDTSTLSWDSPSAWDNHQGLI